MRLLVVSALLCGLALVSGLGLPRGPAGDCAPDDCQLPDCRCSSTDIPGGLKAEDVPQFVLLTFDDAVTSINYEFYKKALFDRVNKDGCPVAGTFFVSHEYTDYARLHDLHAQGQEVALHSITHKSLTTYWKEATVETLNREFADQRQLLEKFAKIPPGDIKGIRMPFLQMAGDNQFEMLSTNDFLWDLSWPSQEFVQPGLWPYSLQYKSIQECIIGPCPTNSFPHVWVLPMLFWEDESGRACSMIDACVNISEEADDILEWMKKEFHKQYDGNRAPVGLYLHSAWFSADERRFEAYLKFIDYMQSLPDVLMTTASKVIEWVKNPMTFKDMVSAVQENKLQCVQKYAPNCVAKSCQLMKDGTEERYMTACVEKCPYSYPWLGNPLGNEL